MRTKIGKNKTLMMLISITIAALFIGTSMSSVLANDSIGTNESNEKTRDEVGLVTPSDKEAPSSSSESSDTDAVSQDSAGLVPPSADEEPSFSSESSDEEATLQSLADPELCLFWVGEPYNIWVNGTIIDGECVPDWLPDSLPTGVPEGTIECSICGDESLVLGSTESEMTPEEDCKSCGEAIDHAKEYAREYILDQGLLLPWNEHPLDWVLGSIQNLFNNAWVGFMLGIEDSNFNFPPNLDFNAIKLGAIDIFIDEFVNGGYYTGFFAFIGALAAAVSYIRTEICGEENTVMQSAPVAVNIATTGIVETTAVSNIITVLVKGATTGQLGL